MFVPGRHSKLPVFETFGECALCSLVAEEVEVLACERAEAVKLLVLTVVEFCPKVDGLPTDDYRATIFHELEKRQNFFAS